MRRFEFSEGSSNKFWQAEIKGTDLWVTFGKIGTAGQTQLKNFTSLGAAQAAMDKLIQEKTKKGYAEVAAPASDDSAEASAESPPAASAKPAASPQPAAAKAKAPPEAKAVAPEPAAPVKAAAKPLPVPSFEERIVPNPDRDASPAARPELPSEAECLAAFAEFCKKPTWNEHTPLSELGAGLAHASGAYQSFAERILGTYAKGLPPKSLDPDGDGAALQMLPIEHFLPYLLARGGFAQVVRTLAKSCYLRQASVGGQGGSWRYFEAHEPSLQYGVPYYCQQVRYYLPVVSDADRQAAHAVAEELRGEPLAVRIALSIALDEKQWIAQDTKALLELKKNEYSYALPRMIFEVLRDPAMVIALAQRHPDDAPVDELLNELGLVAAPVAIAQFEKDPKNDYRAQGLARVETLAAAKALADGLSTKRSAEVARSYYERRPDLAIAALAPIVARGDKIAPYVKPVLDAAVRAHPELALELAPKLEGKAKALLEQLGGAANAPAAPLASGAQIPAILAQPLAPPKKGKVPAPPSFVEIAQLPKLLLADHSASLPESCSAVLLSILQRSSLTEPHPALAEVKQACDAASLASFAWSLFEAWLASGIGSKENWAFTALGLLGDDEAARRLTPLIRAWPGESQHARAGVGLDVLAGIGTDLALMHLHGVAEKVKFKALQEKAKEKVDAIAAARGLTAEELADRLVPDLGLEDDGSLVLDFGPRSFRVAFDEGLKPVVRDADGKVLTDLPKPNKSDDAAKAEQATERWKTLKKDARAVASSQLTRLELAMCAQRRWKAADFDTFILKHPLVVHLARRVVWGIFDGSTLKQTFRVAEDGSLANASDEALSLEKGAIIGLVHRLEVPDALLAQWGGVFSDYKILQPFDQLGRQIFSPTAAEKKSDHLDRMKKVHVKSGKVLGLEIRGWRKAPAEDAGWVYAMLKALPGGFEASFGLDGGFCMGAPDMNPPTQGLDGMHLTRKDGSKATFGELSPTVFSELVREFEGLRE